MTRGLFVTGTGTGVGKTVVTRALARALARRGHAVAALKPVESGTVRAPGDETPTDAALLAAAAGLGLEAAAETHAYRLSAPVSPHLAARRDGVRVDRERLLEVIRAARSACELLLVEGAGGLLVPLSDDLLTADLVADSGCALAIVARDALGSISATLLTLEAARARRLPIAGVVLNGSSADDLGNAEAIARFSGAAILGRFPTAPRLDDEALADAAEASLDLDAITAAARVGRGA